MSVKKYIKFDSDKGFLDNKDDINYFSTNQMRKVAFGKMLGDFDENGLYVINEKIVQELIKMPKVIVEIIDGTDLIRSKVKADAFFHFILTVEDNKVSFKLLEKIHYQSNRDFNSGIYNNINEYVLDEVIVTDKDFNRNALYEKYNISVDNDGEVLSIFDMDELSLALYYNLVEKLKINYLVQNGLILKEKELESIEADYFESVLSALEEFKEFGDKITAGVKKELAEKHTFVIVSKPFFQHTVNEILDEYIDRFIQELTVEQREQFVEKLREIKAQYYEKFKTLIPIKIDQQAGVRFDTNQIIKEGIIGELAQEIETKGYTKSDVRKIIINDGELQLSIAKIKEMIQQNEEVCKRDNAKANDITKGRTKTTAFYQELEKENKVDLLKPDTTLIKAKIENVQTANASSVKTPLKENAKVDNKTAGQGNGKVSGVKVATNKKAENVKKGDSAPRSGSAPRANSAVGGQSTKANNTTKPKATSEHRIFGFATSIGKEVKEESDNLLDELAGNDKGLLSQAKSKNKEVIHSSEDDVLEK